MTGLRCLEMGGSKQCGSLYVVAYAELGLPGSATPPRRPGCGVDCRHAKIYKDGHRERFSKSRSKTMPIAKSPASGPKMLGRPREEQMRRGNTRDPENTSAAILAASVK